MHKSFGPEPRFKRPSNLSALEGDLADALAEENAETDAPEPELASDAPEPAAVKAKPDEPLIRKSTNEIVIVREKEDGGAGEDDIEARLAALDKFVPLIPTSNASTGFTLMGILGVTTASSAKPAGDTLPVSLNSEPVATLLGRIQAHIKACSDVVTEDQLLLSDLVREVDDFCLKLATTMQQRYSAVHAHNDGLVVLQNIRQHVEKTKSTMKDIFRTLSKLDPILDSEERIKTCADRQSFSKLLEVVTEFERD